MLPEYRKYALIGIRSVETLCIAMTIVGFIWATADFLLMHILVEAPVSPFSVLLMLYGTFGSLLTEASARLISRERGNNGPQKKP